MIGAANRDPEVYDDPHSFRTDRPPALRSISFGIGPHSCAGQIISRGEARAVFEVLADRYRRIELAEPVEMNNNDFSRHYTKLSLRLHP